jgi:hypothetical protein
MGKEGKFRTKIRGKYLEIRGNHFFSSFFLEETLCLASQSLLTVISNSKTVVARFQTLSHARQKEVQPRHKAFVMSTS